LKSRRGVEAAGCNAVTFAALRGAFSMDADAYNSQQEAIATKAKEKGVAPEVLDAVFDKTLNTIVQEHPGTPPSWRLGRAEWL
jgi:membrane-bound lytic murein transglycosylase B